MPELIKIFFERWYIFLSIVIVYWTVSTFIQNYPDYHKTGSETQNRIKESETVIDDYLKLTVKRALTNKKKKIKDITSPFRQSSKKKVTKTHSGPAKPQPSRNFKLTGISGETSAILIDNEGRTVIVSIGEEIDGATVLEIKTDKIVMRDNAGKFEIPMQ